MEQYQVTGMSCAACSARVEKAVRAVEGVTECSVSLLTNSMGVEGTADPGKIIAAVEKAGYGAKLKGGNRTERPLGGNPPAEGIAMADGADVLEDTETPRVRKRLIASLILPFCHDRGGRGGG